MRRYILRRLLLIVPTLLGILLINFIIVQAAPGGPVEQAIATLKGQSLGATAMINRSGGDVMASPQNAATQGGLQDNYRGSEGLDPKIIESIEKLYGFDQPPLTRFGIMLVNYLQFDLGDSFIHGRSVVDLIIAKLPVSISLGFWTLLLVYLISIPLGIIKATRDGSRFDLWTSSVIIIGYAVPSFLFAILLIILFAGGSFWNIFPLRGLVSDNFSELSLWQQIGDYLWHITLPVVSMVISGFAGLTMLTKNAFLEEINKMYVRTAFAKGLTHNRVLYGHVFRNAMLIVIAGFPAAFIGILFTGALLTEIIFSLDGLGLLGFEAALQRDYPVLFGSLYIYSLVALLLRIISDLSYRLIDPRIDFEKR